MTFFAGKARLLVSLSLMGFALVACDTADERSQAHYEKGLDFVASGQIEKAMLEFRNALKLDQESVDARFEIAKLLLVQQDFTGALGNFLRVVELDPNHLETRANLARIFVFGQRWEDATRHIDAALEVAPKDPEIRALKATVEYRQGDKDAALKLAREVLADDPANAPAAVVLIGHEINEKDFTTALDHISRALSHNPEDQGINFLKLSALEQMGDMDAVGVHLRKMTDIFPQNRNIAQSLVRWYMSQKDEAGAEQALRDIYTKFPEDTDAALNVVRFLRQTKGADVARAELVRLSQGQAHQPTFVRALASYDLQAGQAEQAIGLLEASLDTLEDGAEKLNTQTALANILKIEGRDDEAKALLETVIAADTENVDALKLRAAYAIDADQPQDAIQDLRIALGESPQDANILTLLASAHERNGSRGLAQERLALAVQVSNNDANTSLRYSQFLLRDDKVDVASNVLTDALKRAPGNIQLNLALGRLKLRSEDWNGAAQIAARLDAMGTDQSREAATALKASILGGQEDFAGTIALIQEMREGARNKSAGLPALVQTLLRAGDPEKALEEINAVLDEEPDDLRANLTLAQYSFSQGDASTAEDIFRRMMALYPEQSASYLGLANLLRAQGDLAGADAIAVEGIEKTINPGRLMFDHAAYLEGQGEIDAAIELYEELYDANNTSEVLANNLASLLSEHRDDPESQERAYSVAKRLRASEVPAYQDTYGWLLYKRGEYERALVSLTKAAEGGLEGHPLLQYHLGMTYLKLERTADAKTHLQRALELSAEYTDRYPQLAGLEDQIKQIAN